jgi:hypothetical protein
MHVTTSRRHYKGKVYETTLLRRSYRQDGKVRNETLANLSHLPAETIELVRRSLKGETFTSATDAFEVTRSLPARARRAGLAGRPPARAARAARPGVRAAGPGDGADHRASGPPQVQAGHDPLVAGHDAGC